MGNRFTAAEWSAIEAELDAMTSEDPYGFPQRRNDSVVMASFNIRALGSADTIAPDENGGRTQGAWDLLARFCSQCDFIAIQEVGDNLAGLRRLKDDLADSDRYALVVSDISGQNPVTDQGHEERLAFLYRWDKIERTELASDIGYDRSAVLSNLTTHWDKFKKDIDAYLCALKHHEKDVKRHEKGKLTSKPRKPGLYLSHFLTFVRTPHVASFRIKGSGGAELPFHAVNAHLLYGDKSKSKQERKLEFDALVDWLCWRTHAEERLYHKNIILFGDMNLEFKERFGRDMTRADDAIKAMNKNVSESFSVNFPFLDVPDKRKPGSGDGLGRYMSTARDTETYDQIGLFGFDGGLPGHGANDGAAPNNPAIFDYNVFRFADVFAKALHGKDTYLEVLTDLGDKKFIKRFEYDVSDHHPIWIRLPKPN